MLCFRVTSMCLHFALFRVRWLADTQLHSVSISKFLDYDMGPVPGLRLVENYVKQHVICIQGKEAVIVYSG